MNQDNISQKIKVLREKMNSLDLDGYLIINIESSSQTSSFYLSGFKSTFSILFVTEHQVIFSTDSRYYDQAKKEVPFEVIQTDIDLRKLLKNLFSILDQKTKIGIEYKKLSLEHYKNYLEVFKTRYNFVPADDILSDMRKIKNPDEINMLKEAVTIAEKAYLETIQRFVTGMTEKDFAALLEYRMKVNGADKAAFDTIVASGKRSSYPHGKATDKHIERGEIVVVDFGVDFQGYNSDITRTFSLGKPDDSVLKAYNTVLKAQLNAINYAKEGVLAKDVDLIAREIIEIETNNKEFNHTIGHGIGLDIHEEPRINPFNSYRLQAGNIVTVEPGIYYPDNFGVRVEDDIVITKDGSINLTTLSKELIAL